MTIRPHCPLRISILTLGFCLAGAVCGERALAQNTNVLCSATPNCAKVTFNANVQITKLHPAVLAVALRCTGPGLLALDDPQPSGRREVVTRGYSGILTAALGAVNLDNPVNRTKEATCNLVLTTMGPNTQTDWRPAVITTGPQQSATASNWTAVGAGSVVTWTQTVTIPSANAAP